MDKRGKEILCSGVESRARNLYGRESHVRTPHIEQPPGAVGEQGAISSQIATWILWWGIPTSRIPPDLSYRAVNPKPRKRKKRKLLVFPLLKIYLNLMVF